MATKPKEMDNILGDVELPNPFIREASFWLE